MKNLVQESLNEETHLSDDEKEKLITFLENKEIEFHDKYIVPLKLNIDNRVKIELFFKRAINDVADEIIYKMSYKR